MSDLSEKLAAIPESAAIDHVREVIAVHEGHGEEAICVACCVHWPCSTIEAMTGEGG